MLVFFGVCGGGTVERTAGKILVGEQEGVGAGAADPAYGHPERLHPGERQSIQEIAPTTSIKATGHGIQENLRKYVVLARYLHETRVL